MQFSRLSKQLETLIEGVESRFPEPVVLRFQEEVLSQEEQKRFRLFRNQIEPKIIWRPSGFPSLLGLTDEERDTLWLWVCLQDALTRGDQADTSRFRHWLAYGRAQTLRDFLDLDESSVPDYEHRIEVLEKHVLRYFYRGELRDQKVILQQRIQVNTDLCFHMREYRRWLEMFAPGHRVRIKEAESAEDGAI